MPTAIDPLNAGIRGIHRAITRSLSVLVEESKRLGEQAQVDATLTEGFRMYARTFCNLLHAHHEGEEEIGFPRLRATLPPGSLSTMEGQHKAMLEALHTVQALLGAPLPWSTETWQSVHRAAASLTPGWITHRDEEEGLIERASKDWSHAEKAALAKALEKHGMAHAGEGSLVMPFIFYNLQGTERAEMGQLFPFILKGVLVPYVWRGKYKPMLPFLLPR